MADKGYSCWVLYVIFIILPSIISSMGGVTVISSCF